LKKYSSIIIMLGFLLLLVSIFISVDHLFVVQLSLFVIYFGFYFIGDNSSIRFLGKFKYLILSTVLTFFFIQSQKDGGYWGITEKNMIYSSLIIFLQSIFLVFILLRTDRLIRITDLEKSS